MVFALFASSMQKGQVQIQVRGDDGVLEDGLVFGNNPQHRLWGGVSYFWLHACSRAHRQRALSSMAHGHLKVVRVFITNIEGWRAKGCGGEASRDIEPREVGEWDDDQLRSLDDLFLDAHRHGVKINLAPHDRWALGCWQTDAYVKKYNLPVSRGCNEAWKNKAYAFYTNESAFEDYSKRLAHILNYPSRHFNGRKLGEIHQVLWGVDVENEALGHLSVSSPALAAWVCKASEVVRAHVHELVAVTSGGGGIGNGTYSGSASRELGLVRGMASCSTIDVIALHTYASLEEAKKLLKGYAAATATASKKRSKPVRVMLQEYGAMASTQAEKADALESFANASLDIAGMPFMYWDMGPKNVPLNYDVFPCDQAWQALIKTAKRAETVYSKYAWPSSWNGGGVTNSSSWKELACDGGTMWKMIVAVASGCIIVVAFATLMYLRRRRRHIGMPKSHFAKALLADGAEIYYLGPSSPSLI